MKRLQIFLLMFMVLFFASGCSGILTRYKILREPEEAKIEIESPQKKLQIGEKLSYKIEWLGMDVGVATLCVKGITQKNNSQVYHITATVHSAPAVSKLYKVDDRITTYLDVKGCYPVRFEKKQREGGYRSDDYTDFDQEKGKALYFSNLNRSKKEYDIPLKVQDPLSCLYYFRLQDLGSRESVFTDVIAGENNYLLEAKIIKKGLVDIKGLGEWEAFMVEPLPWFQGRIKRKAKATIWFSADERRIPLLVVTKGIPLVGTITITLQKIENLDTLIR